MLRTLAHFLSYSAYVLVIVGVVLGTRLLRMWRRTRRMPELLFGLTFWVAGVGATGMFVLRSRLYMFLPPSVLPLMYPGEQLCNAVAIVIKMVAVCQIFRANRAWAKGLAAVIAATALVTYVGMLLSSPLARYSQPVIQIVAYTWMAAEAFLYHRLLRRRLRLGLADPVVTNRIALWGWGSACLWLMWVLLGGYYVVPLLRRPEIMALHVGILGLVSSGLNWLSFYPPEAYLRWITRREGSQRMLA